MASPSKKVGLEALLTPEESVVVLIDHQPFQFANLHSHEPTRAVLPSSVTGKPVLKRVMPESSHPRVQWLEA